MINRALLDQQFPPGRLLRNTGASWDNADRVVPYSDEITLGYERQLAAGLAVSADYVRAMSRDVLMSVDLNPGLRATTAATSPLVRQGSATLSQAYDALRVTYPGFANFTTGVTQPVNVGELDYDALLLGVNKRFGQNYEARVSYTLSKTRGNTTGNGVAASGFQVLDDLHLDLNEGPSNFDLRHNFVVSGRAVIPKTGGLNVSWVARALSGTPFTLINNTRRSRSQRHLRRAAAGRHLQRHRRERLHGRERGAAQRRLRPRLRQRRRADQLRGAPGRRAPDRDRRRHLQPDQPRPTSPTRPTTRRRRSSCC